MSTRATYASFLLAKAIKDLFPKVQLVGGFSETCRFSYDFNADFSIDDKALQFLNDRVQDLMGKQIPITCHEMMSAPAMAMFKAAGETAWVNELKTVDKKALVPLVQLEGRYFLANGVVTAAKGFVKLVSVEEKGNSWRITGFAAENTDLLKERVKCFKKKQPHETCYRLQGDELIIRGKGAKVFRELEQACVDAYEKENFEWIIAPPGTHFLGERSAGINLVHRDIPSRDLRGLWLSKNYHQDIGYRFVPLRESREALISSLQFIQKNANIFGIESSWFPTFQGDPLSYEASSEQRYALHYTDACLEPWEGPFVETASVPREIRAQWGFQEEVLLIKTSLFGSFERFLAFSLNKAD